MGSSYVDDAYKELVYTHPDWQKTADEYEQKFAANLYHTDYVQAAARTALLKLSGMLTAYYSVKAKKDQLLTNEASALADIAETISGQKLEGREVLEEALLPQADSSTGAGQIGNERLSANPQSEQEMALASIRNQANINDVMNGDGNLREQMTMLFNGMFINGGKSKEQIAASHSLKNMLLNITEEELGYMRMAGAMAGNRNVSSGVVRFDLLREMGQYDSKEDLFDTYSMARDLKRANDKVKGRSNAISRWWAGVKRGISAAISSRFTRTSRSREERRGLGLAHYEELGLPLSERERANSVENGNLKWLEGQAYYKMKTPVTAEGLLQTAGPSGTTLRMLGAYKLLGASKMDLLYFRLALIAWMVTSKDHSLYEILKGSHNAGVVGKEDLSEAAAMYQTVDPISLEEIRTQLAPDHRFPHETIYMKLLNELREKRRNKMEPNAAPDEGSFLTFGKDLSNRERHADAFNYNAAELGINVYTSGIFNIMNSAQKYGDIAGRWVMNHKAIDRITAQDREDSKTMDMIYNLSRLSARFAHDGLKEMGAKESLRQTIDSYDIERARTDQAYADSFGGGRSYRGIVYRGGKMTSDLQGNGEFAFKSLTSTSFKFDVARSFYYNAPENNRVILRIRLNGRGAVNVSDMSRFVTESEVLIPAGSKFRITRQAEKAYYNKRLKKIFFESELTDEQRSDLEQEMNTAVQNQKSAETKLREPALTEEEKAKEENKLRAFNQSRKWVEFSMMEIEEVSGPGEELRQREEQGRTKRAAARTRLLQARRAAQGQ